jgi:hypothetical protein
MKAVLSIQTNAFCNCGYKTQIFTNLANYSEKKRLKLKR